MQKLDQYGLRPNITVGARVEGVFLKKSISLNVQNGHQNGWRVIILNDLEVFSVL